MKLLKQTRDFVLGAGIGACLTYRTEPLIACYMAFCCGVIAMGITALLIWDED